MSISTISLNQLAEYSKKKTDRGKINIIKQQKAPPPFLLPWYRIVKTRIRKSIELNGNLDPIIDAINDLKSRPSGTKWQNNNNRGSINALEKYLDLDFPSIFNDVNYTVFTPLSKSLIIDNTEIFISPDIVIKGELKGKTVYGGVKLHISSGSPFDYQQSLLVSFLIQKYLEEEVAEIKDMVLPHLFICLDIFGKRIVPSPGFQEDLYNTILKNLSDIQLKWDAA